MRTPGEYCDPGEGVRASLGHDVEECGKCVTREYLLNHTALKDVFCRGNGETNKQRVHFTEVEGKIVMSRECQLGLADA